MPPRNAHAMPGGRWPRRGSGTRLPDARRNVERAVTPGQRRPRLLPADRRRRSSPQHACRGTRNAAGAGFDAGAASLFRHRSAVRQEGRGDGVAFVTGVTRREWAVVDGRIELGVGELEGVSTDWECVGRLERGDEVGREGSEC